MQKLTERLTQFIQEQPMFFVGTAAAAGRVNLSPKGMDTLRVVRPDRVVWLSLSGSGNETAAHVLANNRITMMFCSYTEKPLIVRLYGTAEVVHPRDDRWAELIGLFPTLGGSRQIYDVHIEEVRTSCGSGVPVMDLRVNRGEDDLAPFYAAKTHEELNDYWQRKNTSSIDGYPTAIFADEPKPIGRLAATTLDCPDSMALAEFYQSLLGGDVVTHPGGWVELRSSHGNIGFQQVHDHQRPTWPSGTVPQQAHIDLFVEDLDTGETAVTALGAQKSTTPNPNNFRVFFDPAGHPFCLVLNAA